MCLIGKDLWEIVCGTETLPAVGASQEKKNKFKKRENKSLATICLAVSTSLQIYVRNSKNGKEAWESLANHFEEKTLSRKVELRRKLYETRLKEGDKLPMVDHINNLKTISENLECVEDPVAENDLVMILLSSLPPDYNNLLTTLETLNEERLTWNWNYVRDRLVTEFDRRNSSVTDVCDAMNNALFVGGVRRNNDLECYYCRQKGHKQQDCQKKKTDDIEKKLWQKQKRSLLKQRGK